MNSNLDESELKESSKNYFYENMKKSYGFWHQIYVDSPVNISLIWKKISESNSEIISEISNVLKDNSKKTETDFQQFLESWSYSIRENNFEKAINSTSKYWINVSDSQTKFYSEIIKMLEKYWRDIQDKNIE